MSDATTRPIAGEFAPYYGNYVAQVADGDIRVTLRTQQRAVLDALAGVSEARGDRAYGVGKWTLKESVLHMIDTERVFAYRLLRVARADATPLPGFDQDRWVPTSDAALRTVASLAEEFSAVRAATLTLVDSLTPAAWTRTGTASEKPVSSRAIAWIIAGHTAHHMTLLREKYLG